MYERVIRIPLTEVSSVYVNYLARILQQHLKAIRVYLLNACRCCSIREHCLNEICTGSTGRGDYGSNRCWEMRGFLMYGDLIYNLYMIISSLSSALPNVLPDH